MRPHLQAIDGKLSLSPLEAKGSRPRSRRLFFSVGSTFGSVTFGAVGSAIYPDTHLHHIVRPYVTSIAGGGGRNIELRTVMVNCQTYSRQQEEL